MTRDIIFAQISGERDKQDRMWGGEGHDDCNTPNDWIALVSKHVGRAVHWPWNVQTFRHQMVIIAAIAVAAVEWADRDGDQHEHDVRPGAPK